MRKRPFLYIGSVALATAVVCSLTQPLVGLCIAAVGALLLILLGFVEGIRVSRAVLVTAALTALIIAARGYSHFVTVAQPQLALDGTQAAVTMRVESPLDTTDAYIVRIEDGELPEGMRLCFWPGYRQIAPKNGDLLCAQVELIAAYNPAHEDGRTAKAGGVYLYAWPVNTSEVSWYDGQDSVPPAEKMLFTLRDAIHDLLYRRMHFDNAAVSEGMMLGVRGGIPASVSDAFRASGVYHLLAVSGLHLTLVVGAMVYLLTMLGVKRRLCAVIAMIATVLFTVLCGCTASVMRAGIMMVILLSGRLVRCRSDGLNTLGLTAALMLVTDPFCLYDVGWQLSFAATFGLLVFGPVYHREITQRVENAVPRLAFCLCPIVDVIGVSFCATLATAPLSALYFGELSSLFLVGNLLCVTTSSVVLILLFSVVLTAPIMPLSEVLFWCGERLCDLLMVCTSWLASVPFSMVWFGEPLLVVWLFAAVVGIIFGYKLQGLRGVGATALIMTVVLVIGLGIHAAVYRDTTRITAAPSHSMAITVKTDNTCGLILEADRSTTAEAAALLRREGIRSLDWVLWLAPPSHESKDLSALSVSVDRLLLTAPPDAYVSLPKAQTVTVVEDGGMLTFDGGTLTRCKDVWCLQIGQTVCLLTTDPSADADALPLEMRDADVLFLSSDAPVMCADIHAQRVVVFCEHNELSAWQETVRRAHFTLTGDSPSFLVSRAGDIRLR